MRKNIPQYPAIALRLDAEAWKTLSRMARKFDWSKKKVTSRAIMFAAASPEFGKPKEDR